ncbi:MAG: metal transporter [Gemmatimonadales bacterium]|nr:metal transporter [Gemmatimonadales bacterium]MYG48899.1 metal transporter [Gemmatimonadales bacterium]MYK02885.1 metal transporter [Candidatus Palauibacter ramosifaciens]
MSDERSDAAPRRSGPARWVLGLFPLALLAGLIAFFFGADPTAPFRDAFPPVEDLTIERVSFPETGVMRVHVVNGGPEAATIAQVIVDDAYWQFEIDGDPTLPRLARATLELDYPWVEGELHVIRLVTSTGLTFDHEVAVATLSPRPNALYLTTFGLLGLYAGVIPVLVGLLWYPFLRRIDRKWIHFYLSLTVGLLAFLVVDAFEDTLEASALVPEGFQAAGLIAVGVIGAIVGLRALGNLGRGRGGGDSTGADGGGASPGLTVAYLIAISIGLHNLGEGLAIGAAFSLGEIALGSFLVIGFALHNTTEGLAIVAPVADRRPALRHFAFMGGIAGLPTVLGAWAGGFSYSPTLATFFLALGAGAILQVIVEVTRLIRKSWPQGLFTPLNATGLLLGLLVMYGTALMVTA